MVNMCAHSSQVCGRADWCFKKSLRKFVDTFLMTTFKLIEKKKKRIFFFLMN